MSHRKGGAGQFLTASAVLLAICATASAMPDQPAAGKQPAAQNPQGAPKQQVRGGAQASWPRKMPLGKETLLIDEPQAESLEGAKLSAHSTARLQSEDGSETSNGMVWYEAEVQVNRDQRIVTLTSVNVPKVQFAGVPPARLERIAQHLSQAATRWHLKLSLDDVLAGARVARERDATPPRLNTDPPKIVFETEPAILLLFDGEPRFRAVEGTRLERALNTPFLVLHDPSANEYYLSGGTTWFRASSVEGPWAKTDKVPPEAVQIASKDLKDGGVSQSDVDQAKQTADKRVPKILVATEPTELIVSDGPPIWTPLVAGQLESLGNSDSDVFRTLPDKQYYLVLSGRWYRSDAYSGPWKYVPPDQIPDSFRKIPSDSPKADALAFVPGTAPAREAVADASKPRTAAVRRSDARVNVTYDGDPRFETISGTSVEYAINTPEQVLKIRGRYYVCDQGIWFIGDAPNGPWVVADSIPEEEIQTIPPESPVYNTRSVYVYDSTPALVYTAYTPAYLGSYPYYGAVVFGTGWFYRPWWGAFYYPRPWTWGFGARFALWGGGWGFGFGWGPAWAGFRYGFGWGWGARWCGPGAFFRPAFRNVSITRNVNINRNVNVTRNVYNSGANRNRATPTGQAARNANASKQGSRASAQSARAGKTGGTNKPAGQGARGGKAGQGAKGGGKAAPKGGHAGGHAGGHGGKH
jgi:hypothetical protein